MIVKIYPQILKQANYNNTRKNNVSTNFINTNKGISFGANVNYTNKLYQKIIQEGFAHFKEVDLIHPNGTKIKGH